MCRVDADRRGNMLIFYDSGGSNGDAEPQPIEVSPAAPGCTCSNALRTTVTARRNSAAVEGATTESLHVHDGCDRSPDPFSRGLDFPVAEMGVTQRHADVGVTEHPRDDRHRDAVHHRVVLTAEE